MLTAENRFYGAAPYVPPGGHRGKPDSPRPYRGGHWQAGFAAPVPGERHAATTPTPRARTGTASTRASSATCSAER